MNINLFDDYSLRITEDVNEFNDFFLQNRPVVFSENIDIDLTQILTSEEIEKINLLKLNIGNLYKLRIFILYKEEKIGWILGTQHNAETFYMINSAVFKTHQNKGIYTASLKKILEILKEKGFQKIVSIHKSTNNPIIIPKLKQGFIITAFEVSDVFGILIHLTYYFNETRRKILDVRSGQSKPNEELKHLFF